MGEDGRWATSEMGTRNRSGTEGISIPQRLHEHLKAKVGAPGSALVLGESSKANQGRDGEEKERHVAYVLCLQQGHFTKKIGLVTDQKSVNVPREPRSEEEEGSQAASSCDQDLGQKLGCFKSRQLQFVFRI